MEGVYAARGLPATNMNHEYESVIYENGKCFLGVSEKI